MAQMLATRTTTLLRMTIIIKETKTPECVTPALVYGEVNCADHDLMFAKKKQVIWICYVFSISFSKFGFQVFPR